MNDEREKEKNRIKQRRHRERRKKAGRYELRLFVTDKNRETVKFLAKALDDGYIQPGNGGRNA